MSGTIYGGWLLLAGPTRAGGFPPTLNKALHPVYLAPHESPDCYGVDCAKDSRIKTGAIPSGTTRTIITKTIATVEYIWAYDRVWKFSTTTLSCGSPAMDDVFWEQDNGKFTADANITAILPCFTDSLLVVTASGSHVLDNAKDPRGYFEMGRFVQEFSASGPTKVLTLQGVPFCCNANGVFSLSANGAVKEWTRPVRDSIGSFADVAIKADYKTNRIIGTAKFAIDTESGKLFDYGTSGFRFTTRTLASLPDYTPFNVDSVAFALEHGADGGGRIQWESRTEDGDWYAEDDLNVADDRGQYTWVEAQLGNPLRFCHRFALRVVGLESTLYIREVHARVAEFARNALAE